MFKRYAVTAALVAGLIAPVASAAPSTNSIWVVPLGTTTTAQSVALTYGATFTAGYTTKASEPWAYAECRANATTILGTPNQGAYAPGDVIWSEYHSLYDGGPVPSAFELIDPIQHLWLGGGADCTISLVKFSGGYKTQTILATTRFSVGG